MSKGPVAVELFDPLSQFFSSVAAGSVNLDKTPSKTTPVIVFCENFYLQFFENEVEREITGVNPANKRMAVKARNMLKGKDAPSETIHLVTWFERFCDLYPDILALSYGGGAIQYSEFLKEYLNHLLNRILEWSSSCKYVALQKACKSAIAAHKRMVKSID